MQHVFDQTEEANNTLDHLLAAFPAEEDAKILLEESSRTLLCTTLVNIQPHSKLTLDTLSQPFPVIKLPGPNPHPVDLAKCMLIFAITLQIPVSENFMSQISEPPNLLSDRMVAAVTTWVTTKEEMHGTLEGLICIMLEGVYKVNCGNLRQAWATYRRAMTVAQMMGLHRSPIQKIRRIDPDLVADPEFMWFRIVYMDRYLSLLLGLPQGTSAKNFDAPLVLQHEPPLGKFERQLTALASYILERNEKGTEIETTKYIDSELLKVSKSMPSSFWRPVYFHNIEPGSAENLLEVTRLSAQVYFYGLMLQLHLPYMMSLAGDNSEHQYSKMTCVNAGREIITRFIAHRSFRPISSCSRPVDFFTLLAAMTLILAHLDIHHQRSHGPNINLLAYQRLSDIAMLEQALERMDVINGVCKDVVMEQSAKLIRRLLRIESDVAAGIDYSTKTVTGSGSQNMQENRGKEGEELCLDIPHLGIIKIARRRRASQEQGSSSNPESRLQASGGPIGASAMAPMQSSLSGAYATSFPTSSANAPQPPLDYSSTGDNEISDRMLPRPDTTPQDQIPVQSSLELPSVYAGIDDWAFQGVDTAFFDTLMREMPDL